MSWHEGTLLAYVVVLSLLSVNGLYRLLHVVAWAARRHDPCPPFPPDPPYLTVQLPLFNERYVVERLVRAAAAIRYPRDRLLIQILDDSTDDTTEIAARVAAEVRAGGVDVELVHRTDRLGFKAGALAAGLARAKGDLVAIFDADFVPSPDFLEVTVPWFADERLGCVQARWGHLNATDSWLTDAQSVLLDGHFVIEQAARSGRGRWFNFNGTGGVWRRQAILDGGGWEHDTLTEDLDLSYRAQLAGWRFRFLEDVLAPAELPPDMVAFKSQQHRWARGSVQTARKLLGRIWASRAALADKVETTAHLVATFNYPLVVLLSLLLPPALVARDLGGELVGAMVTYDWLLFPFAFFPFVVYYAAAIGGSAKDSLRSPWGRIARLPVVLALGLGMSISQSRAVFEGFTGPVGTFVRTPKRGDATGGGYRLGWRGLAGLEIAFALYLGAAMLYALAIGAFTTLPFLALFVGGYGAVGWSSWRRGR